MKFLQFFTVIFLFSSSAWAGTLTIKIQSPLESGHLHFLLFNSANTFGDIRDPAHHFIFPVDNRELYQLDNIQAGHYALLVYFDENGNNQLDKNFIGIPREPLGFSNSYRPKGPPSYNRAEFHLLEEDTKTFDVTLARPLGKRGRIGVGVGVIGKSSPYRDYDGHLTQVIPAITYIGNRIQIFGPTFQVGVFHVGPFSAALKFQYRLGVYEEDKSPFLQGLGDREDTLLLGPAFEFELPGGVEFGLRYGHDVLNEIGGGEAQLGFQKGFQSGVFRVSPQLNLNMLTRAMANHDFGVPDNKATATRPAYRLNETFNIEPGVGVFIEITRDWMIVMKVGVEFLDSEIKNSPIVEDSTVLNGFSALNYTF